MHIVQIWCIDDFVYWFKQDAAFVFRLYIKF